MGIERLPVEKRLAPPIGRSSADYSIRLASGPQLMVKFCAKNYVMGVFPEEKLLLDRNQYRDRL